MRCFILFLFLGLSSVAQAQQFYAFGPKAGQPIETEEQKRAQFESDMLKQLGEMRDLMKSQQEVSVQQTNLLKQQNQLLSTVIDLQQKQLQQQAAQAQAPQQPAAPTSAQ